MASTISFDFGTGNFTSTPSTASGPLSQLFNSNSGTFSLQYPRDLSYTNRGHVVRFSVRKVTGRAAELLAAAGDFVNKTETAAAALAQKAADYINNLDAITGQQAA